MKDYPIADLGFHLASSKNREYQKNTTAMHKTLACFLQENNLTIDPLLNPEEELSSTFKIMRSQLTDEGFAFLQRALDKWMKGMGKRWAPTDSSFLISELADSRK